MRTLGSVWTALLLAVTLAGCATISEKWDRFLEGTEPDRPLPTVPPPPLGPGESLPGPRVIVLSWPGLPAGAVERGMRDGFLPGLRHLRTHGSYARLSDGAVDRVAADAALATALRPDGVTAPFAREPVLVPELGRSITAARPVSGPNTIAGAAAAAGQRAVTLRSFAAFAPPGAQSLFAGAWPTLGTGTAPYTFAVEREVAGAPVVSPGGVRTTVTTPTGGLRGDVFLVDVFGPPRLADGAPSRARIRVTASKDRARAAVLGEDDRLELETGRWSRPLSLRFELADDVTLRGRARLYLRPTGSGLLELYVEPADHDPSHPPSWQPLASPPEWIAELDARSAPLPRFADPFPEAALRDGVLSSGDAAARVEVAFEVERALFERELLGGDFDLLHQSFALGEQAARLAEGGGEEPVVFFGLRVPLRALGDAAAARLDEVVRATLMVAESGRLGPDVTVVVVSGTGPEAWFAADRRGVELGARSLADVGAFAASAIGLPPPAGAAGTVAARGSAMEPLPEVELRRTPRDEAELPSEFDLRQR